MENSYHDALKCGTSHISREVSNSCLQAEILQADTIDIVSSASIRASNNGSKRGSIISGYEPHPSLGVLESEFDQLDHNEEGYVKSHDLLARLEENGLLSCDPRLSPLKKALKKHNANIRNVQLTLPMFIETISGAASLIIKGLHGDMAIPNFKEFSQSLDEIFREVQDIHDDEGQVSIHTPELAQVDPDLFGISICTVSGQRWSIGDSAEYFCMQSLSAVIMYILAIEELGDEYVHDHVACEVMGTSHNEMVLKSVDPCKNSIGARAIPHNPLVISGAIMIAALLLEQEKSMANRFKAITTFTSRMCGGEKIEFRNSTYLSEKEVAHRHWALAFMMLEQGAFPEHTELRETLDLLFQGQALEVNCEKMAVVAATLAAGGICPLTDERVCSSKHVRSCLSLMSSSGVYDLSGQWAFNIGLPAKSCISGATIVVVPNLMGIAIYSPRLIDGSNSAKAIRFCELLCKRFSLHLYETVKNADSCSLDFKHNVRIDKIKQKQQQITELLFSAASGDVYGLRRMVGSGFDISDSDYDHRTALHVAASEGNYRTVKFICSCLKKIAGGDKKKLVSLLSPLDRWNRTPLEDAFGSGNKDVVNFLSNLGAMTSADLELDDLVIENDKNANFHEILKDSVKHNMETGQ